MIDHAEELYLSFFAAKRYVAYLFPLKTIHLFEPVHKDPRNQAVSVIFIAFTLNPRSCVEDIAVVYDLAFQITNLSADDLSKMQPCLELRLYAKIFEITLAILA